MLYKTTLKNIGWQLVFTVIFFICSLYFLNLCVKTQQKQVFWPFLCVLDIKAQLKFNFNNQIICFNIITPCNRITPGHRIYQIQEITDLIYATKLQGSARNVYFKAIQKHYVTPLPGKSAVLSITISIGKKSIYFNFLDLFLYKYFFNIKLFKRELQYQDILKN